MALVARPRAGVRLGGVGGASRLRLGLRALCGFGVASGGVSLGELLGRDAVVLSGNSAGLDTGLGRWVYFAGLPAVAAALASARARRRIASNASSK